MQQIACTAKCTDVSTNMHDTALNWGQCCIPLFLSKLSALPSIQGDLVITTIRSRDNSLTSSIFYCLSGIFGCSLVLNPGSFRLAALAPRRSHKQLCLQSAGYANSHENVNMFLVASILP
jgi:hypothetical protein